jgi:hypothetical protein
MIKLKTILKEVLQELEIPSNIWIDYDLGKVDNDGMNNIWNMYQTSYLKQGMDLSANSASEMRSKYKAVRLKDIDNDKIPDAFIIYKPSTFGNKIALLATNGKPEAKRDLVNHAIKLCKTPGWFIEASAKMEDIMKSSGAPAVTDEKKIIDILGNDKELDFIGDGYYTRNLSKVNKRIVKRIYGIPN